ncbi:MAG: threonine--tRNA ligase [bacterium]
MKVTFPDGNIKEFETSMKVVDIAQSISPSLRKKCIAAKVDDLLVDLEYEIKSDAKLLFYTNDSKEAFEILNHTTAHLLAFAISELYPHAQMSIGPAIEEGFYYDFDLGDVKLNDQDLVTIEKKMMELSKKDFPISKEVVSKDTALGKFKSDFYKSDIINSIPTDVVTVYTMGNYSEACRGPHLSSTNKTRFFKLLSVAGAYFRGDSKNKMLTRIYGTAWFSDDALKNHLNDLEQRKLRDHRRIGKEQELFMLSEYGQGLPFWLPNGMALRNALIEYWTKLHKVNGYEFVQTPIMLNQTLWETSGHWQNYRDNMYTTEVDDTLFAVKPMNCPGGMLIYKNKIRSYRDFPLRLAELGLVHRHEASGALNGLFRVRTFTQDDAHVFMTMDQIETEVANIIKLYKAVYEQFDLKFHIELSTRPEEKYIGEITTWDISEKALAQACKKAGFDFIINEGDGAFYGPKLDFKLKDSMNRIWQCGTIQLDMNLPERFDLTYVSEDGSKQRPVMVHRALLGSIERFIGILTEHYAGAFPTWVAPVQVRLIPVNAVHHEYCEKVKQELLKEDIRVDIDLRDEKLGYKVRESQVKKIPFGIVIGDNEVNDKTITYRKHKETETTNSSLKEFIKEIKSTYPKF